MMQSEPTQPMPLREARAEFDRVYLETLLDSTAGDIARAAEIAEIHPKSFARLMRRYNVNRE
jgi:DNA-binding NtrC family response regulator